MRTMAKRRSRSISTGSGNDVVVIAPPAAAPVKRRSSSRRRPVRRARKTARRASRAYSGAGLKTQMTALAAGGFGVGFIEREFGDKIPSLPYLGRKGTVALAIYLFAPKNKLLQDVGKAAAAISGYELGSTGAVSGGVVDPYSADQGWFSDEDDDWDDEGEDVFFQTS